MNSAEGGASHAGDRSEGTFWTYTAAAVPATGCAERSVSANIEVPADFRESAAAGPPWRGGVIRSSAA